MDALFRIKDSLVGYLSPAKRRRTVGPTTPVQEHRYLSRASEPRDGKAQVAALARVNKKYLSSDDTRNSRKRPREDQEESEISPDESISLVAAGDQGGGGTDVTPNSDDDDEVDGEIDEEEFEEEPEPEVSAEDKVAEYLARQAELALRKEEVERVKASGDWHPAEIFLFERISMRSFEELIPASWQIDFPTLPELLFTSDSDKEFVNFNCSSSTRGVKALQSLLSLGVRVRDNVATSASTEKLIFREIQNYIKWSEMDGGYSKLRFIPVLSVVSARPQQSIESITTAITNQMKFLGEKHRGHLAILPEGQLNDLGEVQLYKRPPPLLYGIIVAHTLAIFVTLDSAKPDAKVRHLTHFDFKDKNMDVWNGFALAFMGIVSRNYIMSIKDELEDDNEPTTDEDA